MKPRLTAERLFSNPPLDGTAPREVRVSPNGRYASWLRIADDDRERLDLWGADLESSKLQRWLAATDLPTSTAAGARERNDRERRRLFGHGIARQTWSADSQGLLIEASATGCFLDVPSRTLRQLTPTGHPYSDIRLSPGGNLLSYVRDRSLFLLFLGSRIERCVARSEEAAVSFGSADFLAQEEMHRFDGHWWSVDEASLAFTRVDTSPVDPIRRFDASGLRSVSQRYPFAGTDNPIVELGRYELESGETTWIDYRESIRNIEMNSICQFGMEMVKWQFRSASVNDFGES